MKLIFATFRSADGREIHEALPEPVPDELERDGVVYRRPLVSKAWKANRPSKPTIMPFSSHQLPKWWPYAPRHDAKGRCLFNSQAEALEACAKARGHGEHVTWDP